MMCPPYFITNPPRSPIDLHESLRFDTILHHHLHLTELSGTIMLINPLWKIT